MNHQQIFDTVVAHLRQQGSRAMTDAGLCKYRGPNNTKCAVGCLIRDEEYSSQMECMGVRTMTELVALPESLKERVFNENNYALLQELQRVHDTSPISKWEEDLQYVARCFGLQYTPL